MIRTKALFLIGLTVSSRLIAQSSDGSKAFLLLSPPFYKFVAGGYGYSLFISRDPSKRVHATGANDRGQLGDGTTTQRSTFVRVGDLQGIVSIAAGYYHSLAVTDGGSVASWGDNSEGQLGNGQVDNNPHPTPLSPDLGCIVAVAAGAYHSLALECDGTVYAWGYNAWGQLGDGTTTQRPRPVQVQGLPDNVIGIAAGYYFSLALTEDGRVYAWGRNGRGQLGRGTTDGMAHSIPAVVKTAAGDLQGVIQIAAGGEHAIALVGGVEPTSDQAEPSKDPATTVWVWGDNTYHQLAQRLFDGGGERFYSAVAIQVFFAAARPVFAVGAGGWHSMVNAEHRVFYETGTRDVLLSWGRNNRGQLGNGSFDTDSVDPYPVFTHPGIPPNYRHTVLDGIEDFVGGWDHSLAMASDRLPFAWGDDSAGQLADGRTASRALATWMYPPVEFRFKHSGKCMDVTGGTGATADEIKLQQFSCLGTAQTNQHFRLTKVGLGLWYIIAEHSGKCVGIEGRDAATGVGAWLWQAGCNAEQNQIWYFVSTPIGGKLYWKVFNNNSLKLIDCDISGPDPTADQNKIQQWSDLDGTPGDHDNQKIRWRLCCCHDCAKVVGRRHCPS